MTSSAALVAPLRLRVVRDSEGWAMVPGRLGQIEWHAGTVTQRRLLAFPGGLAGT